MNERRTKIVCTLGPATSDPETIGRLVAAGMDVARLNMSHGSHEFAAGLLRAVREQAEKQGRWVAVLADLQGPKIRTGPLHDGGPVLLRRDEAFTITTEPVPGDEQAVSTTYTDLPADVRPGDRVLLSDGLIELRVEEVDGPHVRCRVVEGGLLRERQGINLPGTAVQAPSLTAKDEADLRWAVEQGVDYLAVSFVRRAEDVRAAKRLLVALDADVPVIAKIEKPQALQELEGILAEADGVMVARGDMGVELAPEDVPIWQKRIIRAANARLVPVITATQMLESMVREPRPTRAEVTDVANAIWDGTDAVMLSAETSIGEHPVTAVAMMDRIARAAEREPGYGHVEPDESALQDIAHAVSRGAREVVQVMPEVRLIAAFTRNGATALLVSKDRPPVPILAFCEDAKVARRLALYHGVIPIPSESTGDLPLMLRAVETHGARLGLIKPGETALVLGHLPLDLPGSTNFLTLFRVGDTSVVHPPSG